MRNFPQTAHSLVDKIFETARCTDYAVYSLEKYIIMWVFGHTSKITADGKGSSWEASWWTCRVTATTGKRLARKVGAGGEGALEAAMSGFMLWMERYAGSADADNDRMQCSWEQLHFPYVTALLYCIECWVCV